MIRMMDVAARGAEKIETVPASVIDEVLARLDAILER